MKYKLLLLKLFVGLSLQGQSLLIDTQFADEGLFALPGYSFADLKRDSAGGIYAQHYSVTVNPTIRKISLLKIKPNGTIDSLFGYNGSLMNVYDSISSFIFKGDKLLFLHCNQNLYHLYTFNLTTNTVTDSVNISSIYNSNIIYEPTIINAQNNDVLIQFKFSLGSPNNLQGDASVKLTNGLHDVNFGTNGILNIYTQFDSVSLTNAVMDNEKSIYYYGVQIDNSLHKGIIIKVDSLGQIVQSFGQNGLYQIPQLNSINYNITNLKTDLFNNIFSVGYYTAQGNSGTFIHKIASNGNPINTFSNNSFYSISFIPGVEYHDIHDMAFLPNGKIIFCGTYGDLVTQNASPFIKELDSLGIDNNIFNTNIQGIDTVSENINHLTIVGNDVYAQNWFIPNSQIHHRIIKLNYDATYTSVDNTPVDDVVRLFPNPTANSITIDAKQPIQSIQIINTLGQICYAATLNTTFATIDVSQLPKGVYFALMVINNLPYTQKLIVTY